MNFNVGFNAVIPGGEWATAELKVLDLEKVSLPRFQLPPTLVIHENGIVGSTPLFNTASDLAQSENQNNQSVLQHESSVNSSLTTLSRHRWLVKKCGRVLRVGIHIIEEWQGSSSCGIVTTLRPGMGQGV